MIGGWLLPMVSAAFVGSLHCLGMCGGLVAVASGEVGAGQRRIAVQLSYQGGRLLSYLGLGLAAGALGRALDLAGEAAGLAEAAAWVAGISMTSWGLWAMLEAAGAKLAPRLPRPRLLSRHVARCLARASALPAVGRALLLGAASALLPCGFLYAFALAAAAAGSAATGALILGSLWLGSLPALLGLGLAIGGVVTRLKRHVPFLSATCVFVLGLFTLNGRVNLPALAVSSVMGSPVSHPGGGSAPAALMPAHCPYHQNGQR